MTDLQAYKMFESICSHPNARRIILSCRIEAEDAAQELWLRWAKRGKKENKQLSAYVAWQDLRHIAYETHGSQARKKKYRGELQQRWRKRDSNLPKLLPEHYDRAYEPTDQDINLQVEEIRAVGDEKWPGFIDHYLKHDCDGKRASLALGQSKDTSNYRIRTIRQQFIPCIKTRIGSHLRARPIRDGVEVRP